MKDFVELKFVNANGSKALIQTINNLLTYNPLLIEELFRQCENLSMESKLIVAPELAKWFIKESNQSVLKPAAKFFIDLQYIDLDIFQKLLGNVTCGDFNIVSTSIQWLDAVIPDWRWMEYVAKDKELRFLASTTESRIEQLNSANSSDSFKRTDNRKLFAILTQIFICEDDEELRVNAGLLLTTCENGIHYLVDEVLGIGLKSELRSSVKLLPNSYEISKSIQQYIYRIRQN